VTLSNMYLTDRVATPTAWALPAGAVIAPTGFAVVWADGAPNLVPETCGGAAIAFFFFITRRARRYLDSWHGNHRF
jgi:hypothetical protein